MYICNKTNKLTMKAFKAYDIRGVYNKDFSIDDVYKIGYFLPKLLKTNRILVGRDVRISSDEIFEYLSKGINDSGADVYNIGLATTPMVYFATANYNFDASVQITASHNSKEYNGLKVSKTDAMPVGYDTGLSDLLDMIENQKIDVSATKGEIIEYDVKDDYIDFLKRYIPDDLSGLNISIDCSNGMASILIKDILGDFPEYLFDTADGTFPNHEPNPLEEENLKDLKKHVIENKSDIGIIFDGDADRVMFVDETGRFISPDIIIALMADYFLKTENGNVLQDIRSSKSVGEHIEKYGSKMHTWRVGRAFAAPKLKEINGIYGGELAGHYYFRDFFYSDSGIMACLIVLDVISGKIKEGKTVSTIINEICNYHSSGEINYRIENKANAMDALKEYFCNEEKMIKYYDFDGYRIEFVDWWFNVRPSNTEPYLRFIVEARSKDVLDEKIETAEKILKKYL